MRISVDKDDEGYSEVTRGVTVYLDGEKVDMAITADSKEGFVLVYKKDSEGKTVVSDNGEDLVTEKLFGNVSIRNENPVLARILGL